MMRIRSYGLGMILNGACVVVLAALLLLLSPDSVQAAPLGAEQCTDHSNFSTEIPSGSVGMVSRLTQRVQTTLNEMSKNLYQAIEGNQGYRDALVAVITLYIAMYGLFFAFGMVNYTVYDFSIRLIKLSLVVLLFNGNSWDFFNTNVVQFFQGGTDELINKVTQIAIGGAAPIGSENAALAVLDNGAQKLLSANMAGHLVATTLTSAYGLAYGALFVLAMLSFLGVLLTGIWVYLMSMVIRALLFGIAPLFLACMLFDRTKSLFLGWLNQVISACLQPIFLFTFMAFFVILVQGTIEEILDVPVCWMKASDTARGGVTSGMFWWSFKKNATAGSNSEIKLTPSGEGMDIDIMAVLIFLILSDLCRRFSFIALQVAKDIAVGSVDLAQMSGGLSGLFGDSGGASGGSASSTVSSRVNPDGVRAGISNQTVQNIGRSGIIGGLKDSLGSTLTRRR